MSRKRFIKLMMARGYSRNLAAALATQVSQYGSYAAMYQQLKPIPTLAEALTDASRRVCNALSVIGDSVAEALSSLAASMVMVADTWLRAVLYVLNAKLDSGEIAVVVRCKDCRCLYFKDFSAYCPYCVGTCRPDGFCDRGVNRYDG